MVYAIKEKRQVGPSTFLTGGFDEDPEDPRELAKREVTIK